MSEKLRTLVLSELTKSEESGYGLIKRIEAATEWKPSYGSMYPLLEKLLQEGTISCKEVGRKKIYSLTREGKKTSKPDPKELTKTLQTMRETCKTMAHMMGCADKEHMELIEITLKAMQRGEQPFKSIEKESTEMKRALLDLYTSGKILSKEAAIKKIFKKTTKELQAL